MNESTRKPYITVFTPTYNRAYTLRRLYESLRKQTQYDFEWLIVDDGSTDNTESLVQEFIRENSLFNIRYVKKENEELKKKIEALEAKNNKEEDLELSEEGFYYKEAEIKAGKKLRYCAACYNNTGKLYPITSGSLARDFFCSNCKMRYNDWQIPKL